MLIQELENAEANNGQGIDEVCKLFNGGKPQSNPMPPGIHRPGAINGRSNESAAEQARISHRDTADNLFTVAELEWFSRNSYNLALKACADWNPQQTLRLASACLKLLDLYPTNMDPNIAADLSLRRLFCDFLCASLLIVMARAEDNIETQV